MIEVAYAKINLALHVRAREPDGYHRLETVFAFAQDGDVLQVEEGEGLGLTVTGPFSNGLETGQDNLVMRAAERLRAHYGTACGARLTLDKRLPVASGIGGGSADAAAALRLLVRWWDLPSQPQVLHDIAAGLGADVPACLASRTCWGEGRGDRLTPLDLPGLAGKPLLLVNPAVPLSTAAVFRAWDGVDRGALTDPVAGRNDLEPPALALVPAIGEVLAELQGAELSRMSGSGATCFGLYTTVAERDAAAARIRAAHPGWWCLATRLN